MPTNDFITEAAKREGAKPRFLLQIDLPTTGTIYISDQEISLGGHTYRALVKDWGDILTEEEVVGGFDIVLLNHNDPSYGRFSDYEKTDNLTNIVIRVYKWFDGLTDSDKDQIFTGAIDDFTYNANEATLSINDGSFAEHKDLPTKTLDYLSYINARSDDIGKYFPIVFGEPGEELNAQKINRGYNSAPTLLIDKGSRKYLAAGHISNNVPTAVWLAMDGISDGYAYMEGCTADADDGGYSTIVLPSTLMAGYFLSAITTGNYFTNTAQNAANVCDRDTGTSATLNTTYPLLDVMVGSVGELGTISKVKIATSASHSGCRTRWAGPKALLYANSNAGDTSIQIDSGAGFDTSGYMEISGDRFSYTGLTEDSSGSFWTVSGIPASGADALGSAHTANDPVVMVGPWYTLSTAEIDITADRDWSAFDLYKFEIIIEWQSGANYTPSYVGFRLEFELSDYPDVYVPLKGWSLTNRRNAIEQIKKIYTEYLGRASGDIGSSFTTAISDLETANWRTDLSVNEQVNSRDLISELLYQCKARFWLDGAGKPQVKIFAFGAKTEHIISYDTDIVDPDGSNFTVSNTSADEIYNEVYVNFCYDYATGDYKKQYYITPDGAYPADATRVTSAGDSKTLYRTTNTLTVDAKFIQDEATALAFLQYLFDYYHLRRKVVRFPVTLGFHEVTMGDIIWPSHPLNPGGKSYEVVKLTKDGNLIWIEAREYGSETVLSDTVLFSETITKILGQGYGEDGYGTEYGGSFATV